MSQAEGQVGGRRRPSSGGYARGDETRAQIVSAGLKVFGEEGYVRASTRQIAQAAGVNPPALQYYFGSKDGLHRACAEFIIESTRDLLTSAMQAAEAVIGASQDEAAEALCDVLDALVDYSLSSRKTPEWARFSARIQAEQAGPAYQLIRDQLMLPIQGLSIRLVAAALGRDSADEEVRLRTSMVMSQVSAFHINRNATLQMLDWPDFDGVRRDRLKAVLRAQTRGALAPREPPAP